jgi:hypothetical protein
VPRPSAASAWATAREARSSIDAAAADVIAGCAGDGHNRQRDAAGGCGSTPRRP